MERFHTVANKIRGQFGVWFSKTLILIVLSFLFFVTGGGLSQNAKWRIENIEISETNVVSEDMVRSIVRQKLTGNYFFVYSRGNSYLFPKKEIEQALLETFPRLESVYIKRINNNTIGIIAVERKPYALWCGTQFVSEANQFENCWFIDRAGFVFDRAPIFPRGIYIEFYSELVEKNIGEQLRSTLPASRFAFADNFSGILRDNIGRPFRILIKENGEFEITIHTSTKHPFLDGVTIRFKEDSQPEYLLKNLLSSIPVKFPDNTSLKKKLLYIDMRFGSKVIFGFEE
ncbi:MAG: hypothetical protein WBC83_03470 [Minisyncoccia bacterium]